MKNATYEDEIIDENLEIADDIGDIDPTNIIVYSRDWTIETIINQINSKNIDLNPKFQRRNAWTDDKRSKLIESILIGYPVPEIVLAEDPERKRAFIVIDGKQRLLTIAGFVDHENFQYWNNPKLKNLSVRKDLKNISYQELITPKYSDELRQFYNSSLRCTVITNFDTNDVLYDIFYRLNSGSVPLSTQELRQVINRGEFANFLIAETNQTQPIHNVLNIDGPDKRLRDIEVVLRLITFMLFPNDYNGNLKKFLDDKMSLITKEWDKYEEIIATQYSNINDCINTLSGIFNGFKNIGRKVTDGTFEKRFNRVIFEVLVFYFLKIDKDNLLEDKNSVFLENYKNLSSTDSEFRASIESSTKTLESYRIRYDKMQSIINQSYDLELNINPFK